MMFAISNEKAIKPGFPETHPAAVELAHKPHIIGRLITGPVQVITAYPVAHESAATGLVGLDISDAFLVYLYAGPTIGTKSAPTLTALSMKGLIGTNTKNISSTSY
jgi:hypothetical protein